MNYYLMRKNIPLALVDVESGGTMKKFKIYGDHEELLPLQETRESSSNM